MQPKCKSFKKFFGGWGETWTPKSFRHKGLSFACLPISSLIQNGGGRGYWSHSVQCKRFYRPPRLLNGLCLHNMEHPGRFELPIKVLQTSALTNLAMGALYGRIGRIWTCEFSCSQSRRGNQTPQQSDMVSLIRFELITYPLEGDCSIQLSYKDMVEGDGNAPPLFAYQTNALLLD